MDDISEESYCIKQIMKYVKNRNSELTKSRNELSKNEVVFLGHISTDFIWNTLRNFSYEKVMLLESKHCCKFPRNSLYLHWLLKLKKYDLFKLEWQSGIPYDKNSLRFAILYDAPTEIIVWMVETGCHTVTKSNSNSYLDYDYALVEAFNKSTPDVIDYLIGLECIPFDVCIRDLRQRKDITFEKQKEYCNYVISFGKRPMICDVLSPYNTKSENIYFFNWAIKNGCRVYDIDFANLCLKNLHYCIDWFIFRGYDIKDSTHDLSYVLGIYANTENWPSNRKTILSIRKLLKAGLKKDKSFMKAAVKRRSMKICKFLYRNGFQYDADDLIKELLVPIMATNNPKLVKDEYAIFLWLTEDLKGKLPDTYRHRNLIRDDNDNIYREYNINSNLLNELKKLYNF